MADCEKGASGVTRVHRVTVMAAEAEDIPICWICLDGPSIDRPLMHPCRCPSYVHSTCIARWQLQSAGTRREKFCDFCNCELPDWKNVLTPCPGATAPAVMNVNFDNKTYSFHVAPGADGYRQFTEAIRRAFHLPDDSELNITFTCDEPSTGSLLTLSGPGAYDAAVHCASVSAARRSSSSSTDRPLLPPLPLRQQMDSAAADAASDDAQQQPTTPRLAAARQQQPPQLQLPSRHSSASSSSSSLGTPDSSQPGSGADGHSSGGRSTTTGASEGTVSSSRLRRLSRGRLSSDPNSSRSLSRSRSSASSAAHSRNSSSNSLSDPDVASAPGCFPSGLASVSSSNLVAEAERHLSSGSSTSSGSSGRRAAGLGRKLRDALADLLISK